MCGINGYVGTRGGAIEEMNSKTLHRGPDSSGIFQDSHITLGHNLLSIREVLEASKQPVTKPSSPWVLVFNGQLYNTAAMKEKLDKAYSGVDLDTTLLFGLIEKYGWNFIKHIHGMYAIGLYNKEEARLCIYRDPTGQKPLYYYAKGSEFIFSSEIKGILAHAHVDRSVNEESVLLATMLGYIPGSGTLFSHIHKLNPSEVLLLDCKNIQITKEYYHSDARGYYGDKKPQEVFTNLVAEHLQSKQKVALNLSGGMDSSLLLHEMSQVGHEMHTYTNRFEASDEKFNRDADLAKKLAKDYGATHTEITITKKLYLDNFIESYAAIEEPNYNITVPTYLITAKQEGAHGDKNRVILSGDGGDEVFAGYPHYWEIRRMEKLRRLVSSPIFNLIKNRRNGTSFDFSHAEDQWYFFRRMHDPILKHKVAYDRNLLSSITQPFMQNYGVKTDPVYQGMLMDRVLWLAGENFIRSDKIYMSQSVELRSPLAYHPFRQYFDELLSSSDYIEKSGNKKFLRNLYRGKLPEYITDRSDKTGWRSPLANWYDKTFQTLFLSIIEPMKKSNHIIDWERIARQIEEKEMWPGKHIHAYLSLAILAQQYDIEL